jgi:hypothetical protein
VKNVEIFSMKTLESYMHLLLFGLIHDRRTANASLEGRRLRNPK